METALKDALKKYKPRKIRRAYIWKIQNNMYGTLDLNKDAIKKLGILSFNPLLGVGDEQVETLFWKLTGSDKIYSYTPTIGNNLSKIMGINRPADWSRLETSPLLVNDWLFRSTMTDEEVRDYADGFIKDIITYGIPWIQSHADRQEMLKELLAYQPPYSQFNRFSIPVLYLALGRKEDAIDYAKNQLKEMKILRHFGVYESIDEVDKTKIFPEEWKPRYPQVMIDEYEKFVEKVIKY